jgi:hypothetical protein
LTIRARDGILIEVPKRNEALEAIIHREDHKAQHNENGGIEQWKET